MIEIEAMAAVAADDGLFASGPFNHHPLRPGRSRYALKRNRVTSMAAAISVCV